MAGAFTAGTGAPRLGTGLIPGMDRRPGTLPAAHFATPSTHAQSTG
jgi:hypothetical protein